MQEQLKHLVELQILENKKAALLRSRQEAPQRLAALDTEFARFESEYLLKKADLEHTQKMHRSVERDVAEMEAKIARSKQRMHDVKTNREYQAMLKEIEDLKAEIAGREDQALEWMEKIEALSGEVREMERDVERRRAELEQQKVAVEAETDAVNAKIAELEAQQEEIRRLIDPPLLKRWEFLVSRQRGIAVAAVQNGTCQICHLNLPPQRFIELQRDETILNCPHCHRFIYWPDHPDYAVLRETAETC